MSTQTVRRNSYKTIRALLSQCVLVTSYKYDDMDTDTNKGAVAVDAVMSLGQERGFDRVYKEVDANGELVKITVGLSRDHFYTGYHTKDHAKQCLTFSAFAKYFPTDAAQILAAEEAERQAAFDARSAQLDAATKTLTTAAPQGKFFVGQRIVATFASLNKNCTVAQYILECQAGENGEKYWDRNKWVARKNWAVNVCSVVKVVQMTVEEYDAFADSLMENRPGFFNFASGVGSDFDPGRPCECISQLSERERVLWQSQAYELVAVIEAPGRQSFVVNPHGYDYARYVGLYPKAMHNAANDATGGAAVN